MFTIAILSFNHPELTTKTVQSALQHWHGQFLILLVHNGSENKHRTEVIKKISNLNHGEHVQHHIMPNNKGYSGGANEALNIAFKQSDWVLFLTNDCILHKFSPPESIKNEAQFLAPIIWARKLGNVDSFGGKVNLSQAHLSHCKNPEDFYASTLSYIPGTAFWMHKNFLQAVGPFDEALGTYWEDVDLCLRAHHLNLKMDLDLNSEIIHGIGKTCHKKPLYTSYFYQRNRKRVSFRWLIKNWKTAETKRERLKISLSLFSLSYILLKSWISMLTKSSKQKDWQKLKLQWKAIID